MRKNLFSRLILLFFLASVRFASSQCITTYPALETFEAAPVWTINGANSDWTWGTPAHPTINSAGGGTKSWCVGGLTGSFYNYSEQAWIQSPCYNLSTLTYPWVSFKIFWECEHQWDGVVLQSSINGGSTWQNVGAYGDPVDCNTANWFNYNNINWLTPIATKHGWSGRIGATAGSCAGGFGSGGWLVAKHCLTGLAGQPNVIFRFYMGSGTTCNSYDGLAFDDFMVSNGMAHAPDFSVTCTGAGNFNFTAITPSCPVTSSYTWNFGDPGSGASNTSTLANPVHIFSTSGIFTISLSTAGGGCNPPGTITHTLNVSNIGNAVVSQSINCFGGTGNASVSVISGPGPNGYTWTPSGGNSATTTPVLAGTYSASVSDGNGCVYVKTVTITQPPVLTAVLSSSNVSCNGGSNGSATVTAGGGTPAYTYSWIPSGGTSSVATGLAAGSYTALVTDNHGCTITAIASITQPSVVTASVSSSNASCGMLNGSATITAGGGTPGYTYSWTPSGGTSSVATGLAAGSYTATITDSHGCTLTAVATITQAVGPTATVTSSNVSCNGGANGSATVTVGGGTPGYTYSWAPSGGTSSVATGFAAGSYTATITDAHGCTVSAVASITQPSVLTTAMTTSNVSCNGGASGSATVTVGGGTPGYTYSWTPSGGTSSVAAGFATGSYTVHVTDAHGCTITAVASITQPSVVTAAMTFSNVSCNGGTNGSATVTAGGGTPGYTYNWTPSGGTSSVVTGLAAGSYTATVTDNHGCTITTVASITQPSVLTAAMTSSNVSCNGGTNGSATITAGGGTPGYTYNWTPSGGTSSVATGLAAGSYTATVTDNHGCTITAVASITQPSVLTIAMTSSNVSCNGGTNGSATVTAGGGTPAYTYSWIPSGGTSSVATGLAAGSYTATITDAHGCTITAVASITQPSVLTATAASSNISCNGGTNGSATVTVGGGTPGYGYTWLPSGGTSSVATGLAAGSYTATIIDIKGCTITAVTSITQPSVLTIAMTSSNVSCNGGTNGSATVTAGGGTPGYTYNWTPSGGTSSVATGLAAGSYTATITDSHGCAITAVASITQPSVLTVAMTSSNVSCNGGTNGSATVTAGGGTPGYTYNWTPSGGTSSVATGFAAGSYTATITDNHGCTVTAVLSITQPSVLTAAMTSSNVSCNGGTNGSAAVTAGGGTPGYTYNWTPSGGTSSVASGLAAGLYTAIVTDSHGCTVTAVANITQPPALTVSIGSSNATCGMFNGSATVTASGGTPGYTYSWSPAGGTSSVASGLGAGNYVSLVTDLNGCTITVSTTINQPVSMSITANVTNVSCNGGSNGSATITMAGGTAPYTYTWSPAPGLGQGTGTVSGLTAQVYTVHIADAQLCSTVISIPVTQPSALTVAMASSNVSCNGGTNGSATVIAGGGTPGYTYNWTPSGGTSSVATGLAAGSYTATITDNHGCTITAVASITQPSVLTAGMTSSNVSCNGGANGSATVTAGGGTPGYTYNWTPSGGTSSVASGFAAGSYTATITDNHGCTITAVASITQPSVLTVAMISSNVSCNGGTNGSATVTVGGGTPGYTYNWTPSGGTSSVATGLAAGSYTATITDNHGCTVTAVASISQPPVLTAVVTSSNVTCNGGANGSATVTAGGGTPGYTYNWIPSGGTSSLATGLAAGSYTATITDSHGCTITAVANITQPSVLTAVPLSSNVACNGGTNGSATVTASGGTPGYTYNWTPSGGTSSVLTGLAAGSYTAFVTDNHGCTIIAVANIIQPPALTVSVGSNNAACGMSNGSATVTVSGGTPAYAYNWSPAGGTSSVASGLGAGSYTCLITDISGCTIMANASISQPGSMSITANVTNVSCNGGSNGSATITVTGGASPYTYSWSPAPGLGQGTGTVSGLTAQVYILQITDAQLCSTTMSIPVTQPSVLTAAMVSSNASCNGGTNGSATVTAGGGTPGYTYNWAPSGGTSSVATGFAAGSYTATITDNHGCTVTTVAGITQPSVLTAGMTSSNVSCNGGANGSATVTAGGGTPGYTYNWTPSGGTSSVATGFVAGSYTALVTDNHGCTVTAVASIIQPSVLTVAMTSSSVSCNGGTNGSATVTAGGGAPGYTYNWTPSGGTSSVATGLAAGSYTAHVTDNNGCAVTAVAIITQPSVLIAAMSSSNVSCNGGSNGSATVTPGGGTPGYTYNWTPSGGTSSVATGLAAGLYTATVTDNNGCTKTATVNITQPSALTAAILSSSVSCNGGTNGSATVTAGGGTPGYTYNWTPSGGTSSVATGFTVGSYTATVTDNHGCTITAVASVTQPAVLTASASATNISCFGGSNGSASVIVNGGTPVYSYTWSPAGGNGTSANNLAAGVYSVVAKDINNCVISSTVAITQPSAPVVATASGSNVLCFGASNGSAQVTASGGTGPYTYSWMPAGGSASVVTGLVAGNYTVHVSDVNNCPKNAFVNITQPPALTVSVNALKLCSGQTGFLTANVSGGAPAYSYFWNNNAGSSSFSINPGSTSVYTLFVTDANGCSSQIDTALVTVGSPLTLSVSPSSTICSGRSTSLSAQAGGGNGNYQYTWQPGNLHGQTVSVTLTTTTVFTVTVSDGCSQPLAQQITTVNTEGVPNSSLVSDKYDGCAPLCVQLSDPQINNAPNIQNIFWNLGDGTTSNTLQPYHCYQTPGTYTVSNVYSTKLGCVGTGTITRVITVRQKPVADFSASTYTVSYLNSQIQFTNQSQNSNGCMWYFGPDNQYQTSEVNPSHNFNDVGTHLVVLVAYNGSCSDTIYKVVESLPDFTFYAPDAFTPNGDNLNDRFLPKGEGWKTETYNLRVFDRWGEQLFHTKRYDEGWDGFYKGVLVKEDEYVWKVTLTDIFGKNHEYVGTILVLK